MAKCGSCGGNRRRPWKVNVKPETEQSGDMMVNCTFTGYPRPGNRAQVQIFGPATKRDYGRLRAGDTLQVHVEDIARWPSIFKPLPVLPKIIEGFAVP